MAELSRYQRQVVKNYYENLDTALVQRLGEQVTDLYLAEGKKRTKLWASIEKSLEKICGFTSWYNKHRQTTKSRR